MFVINMLYYTNCFPVSKTKSMHPMRNMLQLSREVLWSDCKKDRLIENSQ